MTDEHNDPPESAETNFVPYHLALEDFDLPEAEPVDADEVDDDEISMQIPTTPTPLRPVRLPPCLIAKAQVSGEMAKPWVYTVTMTVWRGPAEQRNNCAGREYPIIHANWKHPQLIVQLDCNIPGSWYFQSRMLNAGPKSLPRNVGPAAPGAIFGFRPQGAAPNGRVEFWANLQLLYGNGQRRVIDFYDGPRVSNNRMYATWSG